MMTVSFSGLGPRAHEWIREIGALAQVVRGAADLQQGLTAVISRRNSEMENFGSDR